MLQQSGHTASPNQEQAGQSSELAALKKQCYHHEPIFDLFLATFLATFMSIIRSQGLHNSTHRSSIIIPFVSKACFGAIAALSANKQTTSLLPEFRASKGIQRPKASGLVYPTYRFWISRCHIVSKTHQIYTSVGLKKCKRTVDE